MVQDTSRASQVALLVYPEEYPERLDKFVTRSLGHLSRTKIQTLIDGGYILVNGRPARAHTRLERGDQVSVTEPASEAIPTSEDITPPLDVVWEDEQIIVVNKPAGMVVHPAPGHERGTLVDALLARHLPLATDAAASLQQRPGIVHRLDKDTSGLLIVAKTPDALMQLTKQFQAHTITKRYLALLEGHLPVKEGAIEAPIGRHQRHRQRMTITAQHGRQAQTLFWIEREFSHFSLARIQIITGRTHQIRVHFAAIGHPVAGDPIYGHQQSPKPPRLFLHAAEIGFIHPTTHQEVTLTSPLPQDLQTFLATLQ